MESYLSVESKKLIYEVLHAVKSDYDDDFKWRSAGRLRDHLVKEGSLKYSCTLPLQDILCALLTLPSRLGWQKKLLNDFFLNGNHCDSFLVLVRQLNEKSLNEAQVVDLLEKFIIHSNMKDMILEQCIIQEYKKNIVHLYFHKWDEIISFLVTLPERMTKRFKINIRKNFQVDTYISHLITSFVFVLHQLHKRLTEEKDVNLEFLSKLLGKLCILGYANKTLDYLYDKVVKALKNDFIWRRVIQRLILGVSSRTMESVLKSLLQRLSWYGEVEWFLGNSINSTQNIHYLLTTKFLIVSYFEKDIIIQNIIGYLAQSPERRKIFYKTFSKLLDVWSDGSALKHQTCQQQLYLTRILMICTGYLKICGLEDHKQDYLNKLMQGVHNHIASSQDSIRLHGMIIGESLSPVIEAEGPELKFEYEETDEVKYLKSLLIIPDSVSCKEESENMEENSTTNSFTDFEHEKSEHVKSSNVNEELDSDDDLEPYDLEIGEKQEKYPIYIHECLEGLMTDKKPEWSQVCLQYAENLIRQVPDNLEEVAIDFCKILLHLEDTFASPNFAKYKNAALVALCVQCPSIIASFLSEEFYNRNYNIRQRLDILQTISSASRELSEIREAAIEKRVYFPEMHKTQMEETWKDIIEKRIAKKTRILSKGRKEVKAKENKFSSVAGHFFFPLLAQFDRTENTYNLLGDDSFLLGHLIYTLGIVMNCAINTPIAFQMGKCFLEFIWVLKYHGDRFVQKALLFALCMVITTVPSHFLLLDLQNDMVECQQWLQGIIYKDDDLDFKKLAGQVLRFLVTIYKEGELS
ncbi:telomere length regulation protein TEL2 homolog isoform X1 [Centruroides vittatus]|uniref:telomere length regulation protein TEL2 homolog isoform X1 n=1 Tax=Centruroides vittatus TaxID=120091 RepID=UPI00350F8ACB